MRRPLLGRCAGELADTENGFIRGEMFQSAAI
jgi:hypothetical protein